MPCWLCQWWLGATCSTPDCSPGCNNGGTCAVPQGCQCTNGWVGTYCTVPVCNPACTGSTQCTAPNTCTSLCPAGCANGGTCNNGVCTCINGWTGTSCAVFSSSLTCNTGQQCAIQQNGNVQCQSRCPTSTSTNCFSTGSLVWLGIGSQVSSSHPKGQCSTTNNCGPGQPPCALGSCCVATSTSNLNQGKGNCMFNCDWLAYSQVDGNHCYCWSESTTQNCVRARNNNQHQWFPLTGTLHSCPAPGDGGGLNYFP